MKRLIPSLVIPLTLLTFMLVRQWWLINVPDGPGEIVAYGFPFIYTAPAFHTSLASQFFLLPLVADLVVYFIMCFIFIYILSRIITIRLSRLAVICIWIISTLPLMLAILWAVNFDNVYMLQRDFEIEVIDSGVTLTIENNIKTVNTP